MSLSNYQEEVEHDIMMVREYNKRVRGGSDEYLGGGNQNLPIPLVDLLFADRVNTPSDPLKEEQ